MNAKEAKKLFLCNEFIKHEMHKNNIIRLIRDACSNGNYLISTHVELSPDTINYFKELGYKIRREPEGNATRTTIEW